jgi:hypothetical protein
LNIKIGILVASGFFLFAGVSLSEDADLASAPQIMERFLTPKPISNKAICGLPLLGRIEKIERFISLKVIVNEQNYRLVHVVVEVWQHRTPSPDDLEKKQRSWLITIREQQIALQMQSLPAIGKWLRRLLNSKT